MPFKNVVRNPFLTRFNCRKEHIDTIGTYWYYWYILVNIGQYWYILVHIGPYWYRLVRIGTYWYILVIGTYWYKLVLLVLVEEEEANCCTKVIIRQRGIFLPV